MTETGRAVYRAMRGAVSTRARPRRRHWWVAIAGFLLTVGAFFAVGVTAQSNAVTIVPAIAITPANAAGATAQLPTYASSFTILESKPAGPRTTRRAAVSVLAPDAAVERGLQVKTILAARAISATFPQIDSIGGARPDGLHWHPDGLALDVMIPDFHEPAGIALGDRITAYVRANADRLGLHHLIWRQTLYLPNGEVRRMGDRGSDNGNHFTHVHIATTGGGFPTGHEVYFTSTSGAPTISAAR